MEPKGAERRKYPRIPVVLKVNYSKAADASGALKESISKNINQGGILISASEMIPIDVQMNLEIVSPLLPEPIKAKGRVVRVEEIEKDKAYDMGIAFTEISDKDAGFVANYVVTVNLDKLLDTAIKNKASDLHLVAGQHPVIRVEGNLKPLGEKVFTAEEVKGMIYGFLSKDQINAFEKDLELDTAYSTDIGRFRVNILKEKGKLGAAFRHIASQMKTLEEMGLPKVLANLARQPNGLILVTGPTGSGKSTTLGIMVEIINQEKNRMIISLEDPIEHLYESKKSVIIQREIGTDSHSFVAALKHTLRQDVDVIVVGEMRDLETIAIALTAAETGHLVLATLHTQDAVSAINRILDAFPANQQPLIRTQLGETLKGVVSQILIPTKDKKSRAIATEVLVNTPAAANNIRQGHPEQLRSVIQSGAAQGMHLMDSSLQRLCKEGKISIEDAKAYIKDDRTANLGSGGGATTPPSPPQSMNAGPQ